MTTKTLPESATLSGKQMGECWFDDDDASIVDMEYLVKTLSGIKAKGVRPELIGSIITHYASKWLPELSCSEENNNNNNTNKLEESVTASWMKKRFLVESLMGIILSAEKGSISCDFLLRLLRMGNMVGVDAGYRGEVEKRISWQLEQATLRELMIPSFSHTCGTVLDVELVLRLVNRFIHLRCSSSSSGGALMKVGKLVDNYLAEAAVDSNLSCYGFIALAAAIPTYARPTHDALYRSIDTYLKAHPGVSKEERKRVCKLMDSRKLSPEASMHAAQNERLPVRAVMQVLLSEQTKLLHLQDYWSGSGSLLSGARSPNATSSGGRCMSKRDWDMNTTNIQQLEIKKLKEEVLRLQTQCINMQGQIQRLLEIKTKKSGFFSSSWKKFGQLGSQVVDGDGRQTPMDIKARLVRGRTSTKWRKSLS